ncbi:MAG: hypothetical protein CMB11_10315, partial [Euryarchaeota archaeon]|nr:hypothetical protein [Euryarchaeota archaeon]
ELLAGGRQKNIGKILLLKKEISISAPAPAPARQAYEEEASVEERAALRALSEAAKAAPHEEHDAQGSEEEPPRLMSMEEKLSEAAKAFDAMFAKEAAAEAEAPATTAEPVVVGATPPEVLSDEAQKAQEDRDARISAFVQLAAAASPPAAKSDDAASVVVGESVTVDTHHRLRVCSFNACKMRLGSANKAYLEAGDDGTNDEYEGTHKGAELAQKWLTLASRMADFDVIVLQEVPGTEKVMNQKIETFASMLDIATEEGREWSAINSQKSGKDGKVVGPGAEVHVCFVKSPVQFNGWNTLRKVGATELDYAPLQVLLHDPRFVDPTDRDFVVTSVHLPPSKRVEARDSQIAALLRNYSAPDTSEYRMQRPFKRSKDTKIVTTHVIAGDFNTYPGHEQYNMLGSGFVSKIPKDAATSSGLQNYDNVLVDAQANDRFLIGGGIMQLKDPHNAAKGEVGLSDHYPVFVEVCEVQKTGKPAPEPLPEVHRQAYEEEPSVEEREALALIAPPVIVQADAVAPPLEPVPEEPTEEVVREVVGQAMENIMKGVMDTAAAAATPAEAPPAAAPATEAPPSSPPPPPPPAPDTTPTTAPPENEAWYAAWREALAQPLPEHVPAEGAALPEELTTQASETDSDPEPGTLADELEASRLEWEQEAEFAKDLPEAD